MALLIVNPPDISGGNYATIPNEWLRDKRLSLVARGILAVLATHRTGFAVRAEDFHGFGTGKETVAKAFRELEEVGYLRRERTRTDQGTWSHVWTLNPQSGPSPDPGKPTVDVTSTNTPSPQVSTSDGIPGSGQPGDSKKPNEKKTSRRGEAPTAAPFLSEKMRAWATEHHPHVNVDHATEKYLAYYADKTTSRQSWEKWIAGEKTPKPSAPARDPLLDVLASYMRQRDDALAAEDAKGAEHWGKRVTETSERIKANSSSSKPQRLPEYIRNS